MIEKKLPRRFAEALPPLTSLFLAISVKHLKSTLKVHPFIHSVK